MRPPRRRPSAGTVLGLLALFVALGGTALAATGQLVNVADPVNAGRVARVDVNGNLRTNAYVLPQAPLQPFATQSGYAYDAEFAGNTPLFGGTSATLALNHVVVTPNEVATATRLITIKQAFVTAGQECSEANILSARVLLRYRVTTATVVDDLPTPLVLKPRASQDWCLVAETYRPAADPTYFTWVDVSGYVVSGTPPPGTLTTGSARSAIKAPPKP